MSSMENMQILLKSFKDHNARRILFVGSAISMFPPANLLSGAQITELIRRELQRESPWQVMDPKRLEKAWRDISLEEILELYLELLGSERARRNRLIQFLQKLYGKAGLEPNANHLLLAELLRKGHVSAIVTTNFDRAIEIAYKRTLGCSPPVVWQEAHHRAINSGDPHIFKLHGHIGDESSLIYSIRQEGKGLSNWKIDRLRKILNQGIVIFVGYSGLDFDICPELHEMPLKAVYWCVRKRSELSDDAKAVIERVRGHYLEIDMRSVFKEIASNLTLSYTQPSDPELEEWERASRLFQTIFNDEYEKLTWLTRVLTAIGAGEDALRECNSLLAKEKDSGNKMGPLQIARLCTERARASFLLGRYSSSAKFYRNAIKSYRQAHITDEDKRHTDDFWLEIELVEAIRCQRRYLTYRRKLRALEQRVPNSNSLKARFEERKSQLLLDLADILRRSGLRFHQLWELVLCLDKEAALLLRRARQLYGGDGNLRSQRDVEYRLEKLGYNYNVSELYKRVGFMGGRVNSIRILAQRAFKDNKLCDATKYISKSIGLAEYIKDYPGCVKGYELLSKIKQKEGNHYHAKLFERESNRYKKYLEGIKIRVLDTKGMTFLGCLETSIFVLCFVFKSWLVKGGRWASERAKLRDRR